MNLKNGGKYGSYDGKFGLKDFELGKWLNDENIGKINFSSDVKGKGFTLQDVKAEIKAGIYDFTYKGYKYTDVAIDGLFEKQLFDGKLAVKDDNIDLVFDGKVDLNDTLPEFDLSSTFNYINLKPLNLVDVDYELSGKIRLDFVGDNPNNIKGNHRACMTNVAKVVYRVTTDIHAYFAFFDWLENFFLPTKGVVNLQHALNFLSLRFSPKNHVTSQYG